MRLHVLVKTSKRAPQKDAVRIEHAMPASTIKPPGAMMPKQRSHPKTCHLGTHGDAGAPIDSPAAPVRVAVMG
jgi:hypothetical protein